MEEQEVVVPQEVETLYHDLDVLLILALTRKFHPANKRAVKEKVKELWDKTQAIVQQGVLKGMYYMKTDELSRELNWFISDYLYYSVPATQLGALGYDGYAIYNKEVYPIHIEFETVEDYLWVRKNETEIYTAVCKSLLYDNRETSRVAKADILMFQNKGYYGIPKHWGVQMDDDLPFYLNGFVAEDRSLPTYRFKPSKTGGINE